MNILHIFPVFKQGGVPTVVYNLTSATDENEYFYAATPCDSIIEARYRSVGTVLGCATNKLSISTLFKLRRLILSQPIDLIHGHGKSGLLYGVLLKLFIPKVKIVHTFHGFVKANSVIIQALYFFAGLFFDCFIALCDSEFKAVQRWLPSVSSKCVVIPNPVPKPIRNEIAEIKEEHLGFDLNLVTFSRIDPQKDLFFMLDLVGEYLANNVNLSLSIYGGYIPAHEEYYNAVISRINSNSKLSGRVFILGEVDGASSMLHLYDAYISTASWEGLPTSIIEAMWSRIPILCTDVQGNSDLIKHMATGFLISRDLSGANGSLASLTFLLDSAVNQPIAENAFEAAQSYAPPNIINIINKLYKRIVG